MANEKRLIDANALMEQFDDSFKGFVMKRIVEMQPVVDAVEVVRCKDCKHWQVCINGIDTWCPLLMDKKTKADDFCSYGERKDNEA